MAKVKKQAAGATVGKTHIADEAGELVSIDTGKLQERSEGAWGGPVASAVQIRAAERRTSRSNKKGAGHWVGKEPYKQQPSPPKGQRSTLTRGESGQWQPKAVKTA